MLDLEPIKARIAAYHAYPRTLRFYQQDVLTHAPTDLQALVAEVERLREDVASVAAVRAEGWQEVQRLRLFVGQLAAQSCQHEWDGRPLGWRCLDEAKAEPRYAAIWKPCVPCQARAALADR